MKIIVALGLILAGWFCVGMLDTNDYAKVSHRVIVRDGECLDEISARFYDMDDRKVCWDEFRSEQWAKNKKNLRAGDLVVIEVSKRVQK